jgi:segregation and condensation protein A
MNIGIYSHRTQDLTVETEIYAGPLALLLQLIERAELDITRLALAQVTDQYLAHLQLLQDRSAEEVSAFLVIASRLLQIKSEHLLPRPAVQPAEAEEDPAESLARQLMIYKVFKEAADRLAQREASGSRTFLRLASPPVPESTTLDLAGIGMAELRHLARSVFGMLEHKLDLNSVVTAPKVTIRDKIQRIARSLQANGSVRFSTLLPEKPTILDVVVTFLAMLELIKRGLVQAKQELLFGEIEIDPVNHWDGEVNFDLEFGE